MLLLSAGFGLVAGPLADRVGRLPLLIAGALAGAAALVGAGQARSLPQLLVAAPVGSVALATLPAQSLAVAAGIAGPARRTALGLEAAGTDGPPLLGVPLVTASAGAAGWRVALLAAGVAALGVTGVIAAWLPEEGRIRSGMPRPGDLLAAYGPLLARRSTQRTLGAAWLRSTGWFGLSTYAGALLAGELALPASAVGLFYDLGGAGYVAGSVIAGPSLGRVPARWLFVGTSAGMALIAGAVLGPPGTVVLQPLAGILGAVDWVGLTTLVAEETPAGSGTTMALVGAPAGVGAAAGGVVGGALLAIAGYDRLGLGLLCFPVTAARLIALPRRP
jgi:DHA1 family bicyclomycin/chloramphenicol resistance-like MFS transporter